MLSFVLALIGAHCLCSVKAANLEVGNTKERILQHEEQLARAKKRVAYRQMAVEMALVNIEKK
jgi:hypothetical protein